MWIKCDYCIRIKIYCLWLSLCTDILWTLVAFITSDALKQIFMHWLLLWIQRIEVHHWKMNQRGHRSLNGRLVNPKSIAFFTFTLRIHLFNGHYSLQSPTPDRMPNIIVGNITRAQGLSICLFCLMWVHWLWRCMLHRMHRSPSAAKNGKPPQAFQGQANPEDMLTLHVNVTQAQRRPDFWNMCRHTFIHIVLHNDLFYEHS